MLFILLALIVIAAAVAATFTIVHEYERAVVFRLGRVLGARGPGPTVVIRGIDQVTWVSVQTTPLEIVARDLVTKDDAVLTVKAVAYVRVTDPVKAVVEVDNYKTAVAQVAQAAIRAKVGEATLHGLLGDQERVNEWLTLAVAERAAPWGVEVGRLEMKDVELKEASVGGLGRGDEPPQFSQL